MKKYHQYLVYQADTPEKLEQIIDKAIQESSEIGIIERPQGGICATTDVAGKTIFYQATISEKEIKLKHDF